MNKMLTGLFRLGSLNTGRKRIWSRSQGLGCMALVLGVLSAAGAKADAGQSLYWQCVQPTAGTVGANGNVTPGTPAQYCPINSSFPLPVTATSTGGGASIFRSVTLTNTAVAVKASAGTVSLVQVSNQGGGAVNCYLQLYDVEAASVTVGTTTPTVTLNVPAATTLTLPISAPLQFATAIAAAATTTPGGSTACSPIFTSTLIGYK